MKQKKPLAKKSFKLSYRWTTWWQYSFSVSSKQYMYIFRLFFCFVCFCVWRTYIIYWQQLFKSKAPCITRIETVVSLFTTMDMVWLFSSTLPYYCHCSRNTRGWWYIYMLECVVQQIKRARGVYMRLRGWQQKLDEPSWKYPCWRLHLYRSEPQDHTPNSNRVGTETRDSSWPTFAFVTLYNVYVGEYIELLFDYNNNSRLYNINQYSRSFVDTNFQLTNLIFFAASNASACLLLWHAHISCDLLEFKACDISDQSNWETSVYA